jgi:plasmid stabilization system protein ParE
MSVVIWTDAARDQLADIWVQATPAERAAIEPVVLGLERDLGDDPLAVGESRNGPLRVEIRDPLTFWFQVSPDGRWVRIVRVHRPRR